MIPVKEICPVILSWKIGRHIHCPQGKGVEATAAVFEEGQEDSLAIRSLGGKDTTLSSLYKREGPHAASGAINDAWFRPRLYLGTMTTSISDSPLTQTVFNKETR